MVRGGIVFIDEFDSNLHDVYLCALLKKLLRKADIVANYAAVLLGDMYANGQLGEPDYSKAIELYETSCEQ